MTTPTPSVPGAINVTVPLTGKEIVPLATGGPQAAQTTTAAIAALASTFDNSSPTPVTATVGTTLSAATFLAGLIVRSGPTAAFTDTTDTAANLATAIAPPSYPTAFYIDIQNTTAFTMTLTGGTGVTVAANTVIPGNAVGEFLVVLSSATAATVTRIFSGALSDVVTPVSTALTTVGAGTITGAGIAGGQTNRTGSTSAFTDTTDTAANIILALPNAGIGQSFEYYYANNTVANATLTGGTGVTVSGITIVPKNSWARYIVTYTAAATITMVGLEAGPTVQLPAAQYVTAAGQSTTLTGAQVAGANWVDYDNTGTTPGNLQMPLATDLVAAIQNCQAGFTYKLAIRNSSGSANTATITTNTGITLTGTMTIAQNVTRTFTVTVNTLTTVTVQSMGISAAGA